MSVKDDKTTLSALSIPGTIVVDAAATPEPSAEPPHEYETVTDEQANALYKEFGYSKPPKDYATEDGANKLSKFFDTVTFWNDEQTKAIDHDTLPQNADWLKAVAHVYEHFPKLREGARGAYIWGVEQAIGGKTTLPFLEGEQKDQILNALKSGDTKKLGDLLNKEQLEELSTWGLDKSRMFSMHTSGGWAMAQRIADSFPQDARVAFDYMKKTFDETPSTAKGFAYSAGTAIADPINLVGGAVAKVGGKAVTLGASKLGIGFIDDAGIAIAKYTGITALQGSRSIILQGIGNTAGWATKSANMTAMGIGSAEGYFYGKRIDRDAQIIEKNISVSDLDMASWNIDQVLDQDRNNAAGYMGMVLAPLAVAGFSAAGTGISKLASGKTKAPAATTGIVVASSDDLSETAGKLADTITEPNTAEKAASTAQAIAADTGLKEQAHTAAAGNTSSNAVTSSPPQIETMTAAPEAVSPAAMTWDRSLLGNGDVNPDTSRMGPPRRSHSPNGMGDGHRGPAAATPDPHAALRTAFDGAATPEAKLAALRGASDDASYTAARKIFDDLPDNDPVRIELGRQQINTIPEMADKLAYLRKLHTEEGRPAEEVVSIMNTLGSRDLKSAQKSLLSINSATDGDLRELQISTLLSMNEPERRALGRSLTDPTIMSQLAEIEKSVRSAAAEFGETPTPAARPAAPRAPADGASPPAAAADDAASGAARVAGDETDAAARAARPTAKKFISGSRKPEEVSSGIDESYKHVVFADLDLAEHLKTAAIKDTESKLPYTNPGWVKKNFGNLVEKFNSLDAKGQASLIKELHDPNKCKDILISITPDAQKPQLNFGAITDLDRQKIITGLVENYQNANFGARDWGKDVGGPTNELLFSGWYHMKDFGYKRANHYLNLLKELKGSGIDLAIPGRKEVIQIVEGRGVDGPGRINPDILRNASSFKAAKTAFEADKPVEMLTGAIKNPIRAALNKTQKLIHSIKVSSEEQKKKLIEDLLAQLQSPLMTKELSPIEVENLIYEMRLAGIRKDVHEALIAKLGIPQSTATYPESLTQLLDGLRRSPTEDLDDFRDGQTFARQLYWRKWASKDHWIGDIWNMSPTAVFRNPAGQLSLASTAYNLTLGPAIAMADGLTLGLAKLPIKALTSGYSPTATGKLFAATTTASTVAFGAGMMAFGAVTDSNTAYDFGKKLTYTIPVVMDGIVTTTGNIGYAAVSSERDILDLNNISTTFYYFSDRPTKEIVDNLKSNLEKALKLSDAAAAIASSSKPLKELEHLEKSLQIAQVYKKSAPLSEEDKETIGHIIPSADIKDGVLTDAQKETLKKSMTEVMVPGWGGITTSTKHPANLEAGQIDEFLGEVTPVLNSYRNTHPAIQAQNILARDLAAITAAGGDLDKAMEAFKAVTDNAAKLRAQGQDDATKDTHAKFSGYVDTQLAAKLPALWETHKANEETAIRKAIEDAEAEIKRQDIPTFDVDAAIERLNNLKKLEDAHKMILVSKLQQQSAAPAAFNTAAAAPASTGLLGWLVSPANAEETRPKPAVAGDDLLSRLQAIQKAQNNFTEEQANTKLKNLQTSLSRPIASIPPKDLADNLAELERLRQKIQKSDQIPRETKNKLGEDINKLTTKTTNEMGKAYWDSITPTTTLDVKKAIETLPNLHGFLKGTNSEEAYVESAEKLKLIEKLGTGDAGLKAALAKARAELDASPYGDQLAAKAADDAKTVAETRARENDERIKRGQDEVKKSIRGIVDLDGSAGGVGEGLGKIWDTGVGGASMVGKYLGPVAKRWTDPYGPGGKLGSQLTNIGILLASYIGLRSVFNGMMGNTWTSLLLSIGGALLALNLLASNGIIHNFREGSPNKNTLPDVFGKASDAKKPEKHSALSGSPDAAQIGDAEPSHLPAGIKKAAFIETQEGFSMPKILVSGINGESGYVDFSKAMSPVGMQQIGFTGAGNFGDAKIAGTQIAFSNDGTTNTRHLPKDINLALMTELRANRNGLPTPAAQHAAPQWVPEA